MVILIHAKADKMNSKFKALIKAAGLNNQQSTMNNEQQATNYAKQTQFPKCPNERK